MKDENQGPIGRAGKTTGLGEKPSRRGFLCSFFSIPAIYTASFHQNNIITVRHFPVVQLRRLGSDVSKED